MISESKIEEIRNFISEGLTAVPAEARPAPYWQNLAATGTSVWLDTGDMEAAAENWTAEMTALTTNNTLLNKEIQKGIYDDYIPRAAEIVKDLPLDEQVMEIAFILNARHGLKLVNTFGGLVSVELHTDLADDYEGIIRYGQRFHDICPDSFIVKVPYTATGLLGARALRNRGIKVNFTLEFSARQNILVGQIARPNYTNVFLGRIGAMIADNGWGTGDLTGEKVTLATQRMLAETTKDHDVPTQLIAASIRSGAQLPRMAGVDVFTIPVAAAEEALAKDLGPYESQRAVDPKVEISAEAVSLGAEKFWTGDDKLLALAKEMGDALPSDGAELEARLRDAGYGDMFPRLTAAEAQAVIDDGKIPVASHWEKRLASGDIAPDTLLTLAGLASFAQDQKALDDRIRSILK